jgi:uncharacterized protein YjiS (DUF1127 family)
MQSLHHCHALTVDCFAPAARLSAHHGNKLLLFRAAKKRKTAMAAYQSTRTAPFGAIATYSFIRFISNIANSVMAWNDARITRNSLNKLSDRELDDIGLTRGDIADIANMNRV